MINCIYLYIQPGQTVVQQWMLTLLSKRTNGLCKQNLSCSSIVQVVNCQAIVKELIEVNFQWTVIVSDGWSAPIFCLCHYCDVIAFLFLVAWLLPLNIL